MNRGQLLVELAISMAVLMFAVLGITETGFLLISKAHQDRSTAVIADWAARHPGESWSAVAELQLPGCEVSVTSDADVVEAAARCIYHPVIFRGWDLLPISSRESAVR